MSLRTGAGREPRAPSGLSGFGEFPELAQEDVADAVHGMQRQLVAGIAHLRRSRQMATFSVRILVCCRMATSSDRNSSRRGLRNRHRKQARSSSDRSRRPPRA